ncbi:wax synthase family protein [Aspergillus ibericus CBS 121593]|uniref:Wax synthase domain-containing protein n=1 Tax=Aspergillus ibericus CBS 121593 TaxID=1448316 RepID=A0A395H4H0_9EURO|nr:hypothetical protein BO80DRAFT_403066 [Aspergillus ibericus CBS 121593]RAL02540.1 hypothetical protein BO80DRAFT_403066 [Aspergillus ibericus CBS 121593]
MSTTSLPEGWHIPITQWLAVQFITGTTIAFTAATSPLRNAAAILAFATAYSVQLSAATYLPGTRFGAPIVAMCWVNVLNAIDLLVLSRASYEAQREYDSAKTSNGKPKSAPPQPPRNPGLIQRYIWSLSLTFNYRRINTPWQIPALTPFHSHSPARIPSRTHFLATSCIKLLFSIAIIHLFTIETEDLYLAHAISHLPTHPGEILFPFLYPHRTGTGSWERDLVLRALFTLSFGIVARATIVAGYTLASMVFVGTGLQEVSMWPPVAGGIKEGWSVRRFWGKTWHQTLRALLVSNADFLSAILHIPVSLHLPFRFLFCFTVSGVVHLLMDVGFGVSIRESGALWFFVLQVGGIFAELLVGRVVGVDLGLGNGNGKGGMGWVRKGVGFVWVGGFMLWTVPVWVNPILVRLFKDGVRMMSPFLGFKGWEL